MVCHTAVWGSPQLGYVNDGLQSELFDVLATQKFSLAGSALPRAFASAKFEQGILLLLVTWNVSSAMFDQKHRTTLAVPVVSIASLMPCLLCSRHCIGI